MEKGQYQISYKKKVGNIVFEYDEDKDTIQNIQINLPDNKRKEIEKYLNTEREYRIPESNRIDDYRIDKNKPIDGLTYFQLAMSTLHTKTDVWVGDPLSNPDHPDYNKE